MYSRVARETVGIHAKPAAKATKAPVSSADKAAAAAKKKQNYLSEYERESLRVFTFNISNIYDANVIPRVVLKDLIVQTINELNSRGMPVF